VLYVTAYINVISVADT